MPKNRVARRIVAFIIVILSVAYVLKHYDANDYSKENMEAYVAQMCEMGAVEGLSIAIVDGVDEYYVNYGEDRGTEINEDTRFELCSTTKAFTGLGILMLEKEGKLDTSCAVSDYLPWFTPTYKGVVADISIDEVIRHTSGIPSSTISTIPSGDDNDSKLLEKTIRNVRAVELNHQPGTTYEYATINYDVLGLLIEKVTGEKYEKYIMARILEPLDMNGSFFRTNSDSVPLIVQGYKTGFLTSFPYNAPTYYGNTAAGYLVSSSGDLMKWMKLWLDEAPDLVKAVLSFEATESQNYYAGWQIYKTFISHAGNNPNYSSQVIMSKNQRLGVFVLSNLSGSSATMIADGIYRMLLGEHVKIGLWIDSNAFVDFFSVMSLLIMAYCVLFFWNRRSKQACLLRICLSVTCIIVILIFPYLMRYSYTMLFVWTPVTVFVALGTALFLSIWNLLLGIFWYNRTIVKV